MISENLHRDTGFTIVRDAFFLFEVRFNRIVHLFHRLYFREPRSTEWRPSVLKLYTPQAGKFLRVLESRTNILAKICNCSFVPFLGNKILQYPVTFTVPKYTPCVSFSILSKQFSRAYHGYEYTVVSRAIIFQLFISFPSTLIDRVKRTLWKKIHRNVSLERDRAHFITGKSFPFLRSVYKGIKGREFKR